MGLRKISISLTRFTASPWLVPSTIAAISVLIALGGDAARQALKYDRLAVGDGEWWRLLSGHLAHLGGTHLALNLAGLLLVWMLVGRRLSTANWLGVVLFSVAVLDLGFWMLDDNLFWYVGLSGLLHALLVAGAAAGFGWESRESLIIVVLVSAKIAYEQIGGPLPGSEATSGGPVVVNAHLYGALAGLLAGVALWRRAARGRSI